VQAWYQGGVSVFDFTDSARPTEIAFFDRGPIDATELHTGGYWSAYWYNGAIYGSEIARGLDVFRLLPSEYLTENEINAAAQVHVDEQNTQEQARIVWPATNEVALAYLDQLTRTSGIRPDRAAAVRAALEKSDGRQLDALADRIGRDAAGSKGRDAQRLKALAETLKGRATKLRSS
jgi:hypothetical protein